MDSPRLNKNFKNRGIKIGLVASVLPHLFCCVLPVVLSVISLVAPEVAHTKFVPEWIEPWIFVFSGLMLGFSWTLVISDCKCQCKKCQSDVSHHTQKIILGIISMVFVIRSEEHTSELQ